MKTKSVYLSCILGLISFVVLVYGIFQLAPFVSFLFFRTFLVIIFLMGLAAVFIGIKSRKGLVKKEFGKRIATTIGIMFGIMNMLIVPVMDNLARKTFPQRGVRSKVSREKAELQSIATALEAYYIDQNSYPQPDFDEKGKPVLPKILTTPTAYLTSLFRDPFKNSGKGFYEYGTNGGGAWIMTGYGPDCVDGSSGVPSGRMMIESIAWSDEELDFNLFTSDLTYDPTNGTVSPGDVWRRGP